MNKRAALRASLALAAVTLAFAANTGSASAAVGNHGSVSAGNCTATLNIGTPTGGHEYARVIISGTHDADCSGLVLRSSNNGDTWADGPTAETPGGQTVYSAWIYDGPGYMSKVCAMQHGAAGTGWVCQSTGY